MFSSLCLHEDIIILLTKISIYTRFKDRRISLGQWQIMRVILQLKRCWIVFSQLKVLKTSDLGCVWATFLLTYLLKLIVVPNNLSKNIKELIINR